MATLTADFSHLNGDTDGGVNDRTVTICSAGTNVKPEIPDYAILNNVTLSFAMRDDKWISTGDCYVYAGSSQWSGKLSIKYDYSTFTVDKNNLSSILSFFNSGAQNVGVCNGNVYLQCHADLSRNFYWKDIKIVFDYTVQTFTLTVNAGTGGTVTGGGTYNNQATATLTATPNTGYKFVKWSDGNTSATRTVTVTGNATYTAYFEPIYILYDSIFSFKRWANNNLTSWDLITISNLSDTGFTGTATVDDAYTTECRPLIPVTNGTTYTFECDTSGGSFEFFIFNCNSSGAWSNFTYGNTKKFNFTASTDYVSIRCDVVGTGTVVNFSNFRIYPADRPYMSNSVSAADRTDKASWSMPTPTREGYTFKGWNTKPDGSGTTYTSSSAFPSDSLVLYSQWAIKTYAVTFKDENGATLKTETVNHGSKPTPPANPTKADTAQWDYTFDGWYDAIGNKWTSDTVITSDTVFTARYTAVVQKYTITASGTNGTVTGGGTYEYGESVTLTATPNDGYKFVKWSDGVDTATRTVTVTGAAAYTAIFEKAPPEIKLVQMIYLDKQISATNKVPCGEGFIISVELS